MIYYTRHFQVALSPSPWPPKTMETYNSVKSERKCYPTGRLYAVRERSLITANCFAYRRLVRNDITSVKEWGPEVHRTQCFYNWFPALITQFDFSPPWKLSTVKQQEWASKWARHKMFMIGGIWSSYVIGDEISLSARHKLGPSFLYCKARNKCYRKETLGSSSDFVGVKSTACQAK